MFGSGGKLFLTDAPDGDLGGIRTLVQLDGHVVTRATEASMLDADLLARHRSMIEVWFAELHRDWTGLSRMFTSVATAGTAAAVAGDLTVFSHPSGAGIAAFALPVILPVLRKAGSAIVRRRMLAAGRH